MGPILSSEQIHNIAVDLLSMSREEAYMRIGGMQISEPDRRRIIAEYEGLLVDVTDNAENVEDSFNEEAPPAAIMGDPYISIEELLRAIEDPPKTDNDTHTATTDTNIAKKTSSWWRFIVAPIAGMAIFIFAPGLVALLFGLLGYFFSGFEADIISLFMYAISSALGLYATSIILSKKQKIFAIVLTIIFISSLPIVSMNTFANNDPLAGIGAIIGIIASIITCVTIARDHPEEQIKAGGIVGIVIASVLSILYFLFCLFLSVFVQAPAIGGYVAYTENGQVYHSSGNCVSLSDSDVIFGTIEDAEAAGKNRRCKLCYNE